LPLPYEPSAALVSYDTLKCVTLPPPLSVGRENNTVNLDDDVDPDFNAGFPGADDTATSVVVSSDHAPPSLGPTAFVANALNLYVVPGFRPLTDAVTTSPDDGGDTSTSATPDDPKVPLACFNSVFTVYFVTLSPPSLDDTANDTLTCVVVTPDTDATPGADGFTLVVFTSDDQALHTLEPTLFFA
jgi:hypothetical protein